MKEKLKGLIPHIIAVIAFILISVIYFHPVLQGEELRQYDNIQAAGMSHEITQFEQQTGEYSAWTNSMFGGMPSYQIKAPESFNIHLMLQRFLHLFLPYSTMAIFFVYLLGFYLLLTSLKFRQGISIVGALAFAFSSYNIIIIAAGHITKCYAIAYMAPVLAGIIHCYNKEYIKGFFLTAFALGIEIACNHPQIVYYLGILCGVFFVWKAVCAYLESKKEKEPADGDTAWKSFGKATAVVAIAGVFAILPNITNLWTTWEYGKYSTRSQSELSSRQESSGLDKNYAMAWSYGKMESLNLLIPNFRGGASQYIGNDADAMKAVKDNTYAQSVARTSQYWGDQPGTSGPVYLGAIVVFLFVLGLFIVKSNAKWWLLAGTAVSIIMSWGNNCNLITDLLFDYFPLYNKFRSVSMALVIAQVCVPFLAMMALKEITDNADLLKTKKKELYISLGITAGLCLIFWLIPSLAGSFLSSEESATFAEIIKEQPNVAGQYQAFSDNIVYARKALFCSDALRSAIFILLAGLVLFLYSNKTFKTRGLVLALGALITIDLWAVDVRYLGTDDFRPENNSASVFRPSAADQFIIKDTDPDFRVFNLTTDAFNEAQTSYYHKSIGGYHGAKMRRYQEFISALLNPSIEIAMDAAKKSPEKLSEIMTNIPMLNMLNCKYIIANREQFPIINMNTYGNAWFVNKYDAVETADQELVSLRRQDPRQTAVINKNIYSGYMNQLPKDQIVAEDSSAIVLNEYKPNYLSYSADAKRDRLAVFSEIYYPKGWQAYIDGKAVDHICANYILRALVVPAGQHKIEFKFDPTSVRVGKIIAALASILLILGLIAYLYKVHCLDKKKN